MHTIKDLAQNYQSSSLMFTVDELTKASGILRTIAVTPSNHGLEHWYSKGTSLPTASIRNIGGSVTSQNFDTQIMKTTLEEFCIYQAEDWSLVRGFINSQTGQPDESLFWASKLPGYNTAMGQKLSNALIYGNDATFGDAKSFKGFHQYVKDFHSTANPHRIQLGGTTGSRTTIFFVKPSINDCCGLYNDAAWSEGNPMTLMPISPTVSAQVTNTTTRAVQLIKDVYYYMHMGFYCSGMYHIAAITQCDSSHKPTVAQVESALKYIRAYEPGEVYIYCNATGLGYLEELKGAKIQTTPSTMDFNSQITTWGKAQIVVDDNILSTETTVLD